MSNSERAPENEEFERMKQLFVDDPEEFERQAQAQIDKLIDEAPPFTKDMLRKTQLLIEGELAESYDPNNPLAGCERLSGFLSYNAEEMKTRLTQVRQAVVRHYSAQNVSLSLVMKKD